uniref:Ovule protein n=1 Tax=Meloidogyne hapla TaxID=6305 RepID=A0A1I8AXD8_MELHA
MARIELFAHKSKRVNTILNQLSSDFQPGLTPNSITTCFSIYQLSKMSLKPDKIFYVPFKISTETIIYTRPLSMHLRFLALQPNRMFVNAQSNLKA